VPHFASAFLVAAAVSLFGADRLDRDAAKLAALDWEAPPGQHWWGTRRKAPEKGLNGDIGRTRIA